MNDKDLFNLTNRVVVVTGGGSGIGRRVALAMAEYGARIVIADINEKAADSVVSEITNKNAEGIAIKVDVTNPINVQQMVNITTETYARIDILFNNAGIIFHAPAETLSLEDWNRVISVNLTGVFIIAQTVGKVMIKQRKGKIINTSSISGKLGHPGNLAYAAAKHGVIGMTKVMAVEWAKYNINVNCIGPGPTRTPLTKDVFANDERYQQITSKIPMGRLAEPEDLIGGVIFLSSDASNYLTGQTIYIDGGRMID
jgi:NAD(P)-dependent dehydrogenase (short-subunit alcohol dehydrogenase family)